MKSTSLSRQQGYILVMSLLFLILLTVMALTQVALNSSQTRLATNATDTAINYAAAEGALNEGVNKILNGTYTLNSFLKNTPGLYVFKPAMSANPLWKTVDWGGGSVISGFSGSSATAGKYFVEQLPSVIQPGQNMKIPTRVYRVTARKVQANGNTMLLMQTTVQTQQ